MTLNKEQERAVKHLDGPLLVLAGAGTGKTGVVTQRVVHLLENGIPPYAILAVTFTNKAVEEMRRRVQEKVLICTFHSLGARILRESIHHLGYPRNFTIYDEEDSLKLLKSCLESFSFSDKKRALKEIRAEISTCKNELGECIEEQQVFDMYQTRLKENGAVDFDDLLCLPVKLFERHPDVLAAYQARWRYLLVDEYQDTNHAQYIIMRALTEKSGNCFAVGDPDQSIYSWRGANVKNILNFERDFPGATVIRLEQNYRSHNIILEASNALISHNDGRYDKNLWSDREDGDLIQLHAALTDRDEAEYVIQQIENEMMRGTSLSEIVIFYRTNFQSRLFEDHLRYHNLPYVIVGGVSFYQRREIKDVLAYLRLLTTESDFIAFQRTVNLPKRGIGPAIQEKLRIAASESEQPIMQFCQNPTIKLNKTQKAGLDSYLNMFLSLKESLPHISLSQLILEVLEYYEPCLKTEPETYLDRLQNVQELASKAAEWEEMAEDPTLALFLSELALQTSTDEVGDETNRLTLMTLHNGKGLEFDTVFMVGMEEDLFPHINCKDSPEMLEEERRLCYVGMTRARERLTLTSAGHRYMWGMLRQNHASRFLIEIPEKYLSVRD